MSSACWFLIMPSDFSTADAMGHPIDRNPYYGWRSLLFLASTFAIAALGSSASTFSRRVTVIALTATSTWWYSVFASSARTSGANMWAVGLLWFPPVFAAVAWSGWWSGKKLRPFDRVRNDAP